MHGLTISPAGSESQADFAIRFHEAMQSQIPNTDLRDAEMMKQWRASNDEPLHRAAAQRFSKDHEMRRDCPVFAEHSTHDPEGNLVVYDRNALVAVMDRNNHRIEDTGDFAPITEGHTPDRDQLSRGAKMPDVLGWAGPYRLGMVGNKNPRWAIFGDEWHGDAEKLSRLRRRSPEVWLEDKMEDRFFDPIAALGAETPRLDMGMTRMCRLRDGRTVMKYSAVAPSATSTFVPSYGDDDDDTDQYQSEESTMLSPEDVEQVVDALLQTAPMQWVQDQMATAPSATAVGEEIPPPASPPEPPPAAAAPPEAAIPPPDAAPPVPPPAAAAAPPEVAAAPPPAPEPEDEDKAMMSRYMAGECDDDEMMDYCASRKQSYQAGAAEGSEMPPDEEGLMPVESTEQYKKLQTRFVEQNQRLTALEQHGRHTERYSRLNELRLRDGVAIEVDEVFDVLKDVSTEEWDRQIETLTKYSKRAPLGVNLYTPDTAIRETMTGRDPGQPTERQAKAAQKYCLSERRAGRQVTFAEALDHIKEAG